MHNTFISEAIKVWNKACMSIKSAKVVGRTRKEIKAYCRTLPA
jgi:hypothetical protein